MGKARDLFDFNMDNVRGLVDKRKAGKNDALVPLLAKFIRDNGIGRNLLPFASCKDEVTDVKEEFNSELQSPSTQTPSSLNL